MILMLVLMCGQKVELPAEIQGEVGSFIAVRPKTDGKLVRYYSLDAGLNSFPAELLSDPTATVVTAPKAGRYRLLAYTALGDRPSDPVIVTIVVGAAPPTPPVPTPGEYERSLLDIYGALQEPDRDATRIALAKVYRSCVTECMGSHATAGDLYQALIKIASAVPATKLSTLRDRVGAEVAKIAPNDPTATITAAQRASVGDIYERTATLLESIR
jgi:hypothetical protein